MSDLNQLSLDTIPQGAVLLREGRVAALNTPARQYLPWLEPGSPTPDVLPQLSGEEPKAGTFSLGRTAYSFRLTPTAEGQLLLFQPAPQTALTDGQLNGILGQLRQFMGEFLLEMGSTNNPRFRKSFHQMFRLVDNLEFLLAAAREETDFRPVTLDLAGLCHQVVREAGDLLSQCGVELRYEEEISSLLLSGDPVLLQRALFELLANAAHGAEGGTLFLRLKRQRNLAILTLSGSGSAPSPRQQLAMVQPETGEHLPLPGTGAGLGLPMVRHIAALHGGSLLFQYGNHAPLAALSLPIRVGESRLTVESPSIQRDGGLHPALVALSDLLPARTFEETELD